MIELQLSVSEAEAKGLIWLVLLGLDDSIAPAMCISKLYTADHIGQGDLVQIHLQNYKTTTTTTTTTHKSLCLVDRTLATTTVYREASIITATLVFQEPK